MSSQISAFSERFYTSRHRLLRYLLKLGHAIDADTPDLVAALTTRFCDALVDYLSTGHFQVLERFSPTLDQVAAFEATTRQALGFCDQFGNESTLDTRSLRTALEALIFVIDSRMDVEDEVIQQATVPARSHRVAGFRPRQIAHA